MCANIYELRDDEIAVLRRCRRREVTNTIGAAIVIAIGMALLAMFVYASPSQGGAEADLNAMTEVR